MSDWDRDLEKFREKMKTITQKNREAGRADVQRMNEIQRQRREAGQRAINYRRAKSAKENAERLAKSAETAREDSEFTGKTDTSKIVQKAPD